MDIKNLLSRMTLKQKLAQILQCNALYIAPDASTDLTGPMEELPLTKEQIECVGSVLNLKNATEAIKVQRRI